MRWMSVVAVMFGLLVAAANGQQVIVNDTFESGSFDSEWTTTSGTGTEVVNSPGNGTGNSDHFARIEGVSGSGGLGVSLVGISNGSASASSFVVTVDFRVDSTASGIRQFSFMASAGSATPGTCATLNLRYQDGQWSAFDSSWRLISGLGPVAVGEWNRLMISGNYWGSGVPGGASVDLELTDHNGGTSNATGLQIWQSGDPDGSGAMSVSLNDIWGSNPGFDVDNVTVVAVPQESGPETSLINPTNPVKFSGVYAHMAMSNNANESGVGGVILRDGKLYMMTYPPHSPSGSSSDKLYEVDLTDLSQTTYLNYSSWNPCESLSRFDPGS